MGQKPPLRKPPIRPLNDRSQSTLADQSLDPIDLIGDKLARRVSADGYVHAAVFGLPLEKGRVVDPVLVADIGRLRAGLLRLDDCDDLLFAEPALLYGPTPGHGSYPFLEEFS